jgi:hypothetical protein
MAANLVQNRPRPRSPLLVDKILSGGTAIGSADAGAATEFVGTLQKLEHLYIHRLSYQQKIRASGLGDPRKRKGVGIDLLLDVDTVKQTDALEARLQELIDEDSVKEGGGDLGQFFLLWRQHWQHTHAERVVGKPGARLSPTQNDGTPLPSKILYAVEMKRRAVNKKPAKMAWRAAISPAKSPARNFSHPGYLTESFTETKDYFLAKQEVHDRTGRFRTGKAASLGLDVHGQLRDRETGHLVVGGGGRRTHSPSGRRSSIGQFSVRESQFRTPTSQGGTGAPIYVASANTDRYMLAGLPDTWYDENLSGLPDIDRSLELTPAFVSAKNRIKATIDRLNAQKRQGMAGKHTGVPSNPFEGKKKPLSWTSPHGVKY